MSHMVNEAPAQSQATSVVRVDAPRTTDVALAKVLARLRACIADCGYTSYESLAVAMGKKPSYRSYIWKVLNGEKPFAYDFVIDLPDDVEGLFYERSAEDFGRMVVAPAPSGTDAAKQFMAGVFGLLQHGLPQQMPAKAGPPVKATLDSSSDARERRLA